MEFVNATTLSALDMAPALREYLYTVAVFAIAVNQIIGPPFFKVALRLSGEIVAQINAFEDEERDSLSPETGRRGSASVAPTPRAIQ